MRKTIKSKYITTVKYIIFMVKCEELVKEKDFQEINKQNLSQWSQISNHKPKTEKEG